MPAWMLSPLIVSDLLPEDLICNSGNTTKSIIGHGLSAAGVVEVAAVLLQMQTGWLHPSRNLDDPLRPDLNWI
ncbi:hypothetical protein [Chitinophaga sp.]|uniref:hypothetical protein n=1 Tax=Chitinophaga sp. TaxID=1869181 RepID=UPI0032C21BEE